MRVIFVVLLSLCSASETSPRFMVHLLDYLAKDYVGAVGADHKVISSSEYKEQKEFVNRVALLSQSLPELKDQNEIVHQVGQLRTLIEQRQSPAQVSQLARKIQSEVVSLAHIDVSPTKWPNLEAGHQVYQQNCVACHGEKGDGNGPAAKGLNPQNFLDNASMSRVSPFDAFNAIRLGVPGTAMQPFADLSDDDVWNLAFYISSLRYQGQKSVLPQNWSWQAPGLLKKVASLSDESLHKEYPSDHILAALRTHSSQNDQNAYLALAQDHLNHCRETYQKGQLQQAKDEALKAYLDGIEPVESRIRAIDNNAVNHLEQKMADVRAAVQSRQSQATVDQRIQEAQSLITQTGKLLQEQELSSQVAFGAAFLILLREGFEAVLVILALLGVIRASGSRQAALSVHAGWILAVGCGVVAWFCSGWLLDFSGANREMMEGVTSLFAVFILLYVGFWLHRQTEIGRWKEFLEVRVRNFLHGKNLVGLGLIAFTAVFREAFETVLFLRAIWVECGAAGKSGLLIGIGSSFIFVLALSALALKFSRKLPIRKLFTVSSILMLILAGILAGKGVHSLQETGAMGVTSWPLNLRSDLLGIYPTVETMATQVIVLAIVILLWIYGRKPARRTI